MRIAFDARSLANPVLRGWDRYTVGLVRSLVECGVEPILLHTIREPICEKHLAEIDARTFAIEPLFLRDLSDTI